MLALALSHTYTELVIEWEIFFLFDFSTFDFRFSFLLSFFLSFSFLFSFWCMCSCLYCSKI